MGGGGRGGGGVEDPTPRVPPLNMYILHRI